MAEYVRLWGPMWAWSGFPLEDGNGHMKKISHGSNKLDGEIANALTILSAYRILKYKLFLNTDCDKNSTCLYLLEHLRH